MWTECFFTLFDIGFFTMFGFLMGAVMMYGICQSEEKFAYSVKPNGKSSLK